MALRIRGILYNAIRYLFCLMRALFPVCFVCAQLCRAQAPSLTSVPRWCPQSLRRPLPVSQRNQLLRWGYRKKGGGASPWVRSQLWECMGGVASVARPGEDPTPTPVLLRGSSTCRQFGRRDGGGSQPISISFQSPLPEEELALQEGKGRTCPTLSSSTVPLHDDSFHDSSP